MCGNPFSFPRFYLFSLLATVKVGAHKSIFGFYIDNKGVIREFEIRDETTPYGKNMNDVNYCMNIVKEIYSGLEDISADMGLRVKKDDLILYYNPTFTVKEEKRKRKARQLEEKKEKAKGY